MNSFLNAAIGPFSVVQLVIIGACLTLEIRRAVSWHIGAKIGDPPPSKARVLGRRYGAWTRALLTAAFGIGVLLGSRIALIGIAITLVAGGLRPSLDFAEGLLAGLKGGSKRHSTAATALIAGSYVGVTRGVPVALLYAASTAA